MSALLESDRQRLRAPSVGPAPETSPPSGVGKQVLHQVCQRLRAAYDSTVKEPLPLRLADLVERLARRETGRD
jgi:Anti-sigma factor NepR